MKSSSSHAWAGIGPWSVTIILLTAEISHFIGQYFKIPLFVKGKNQNLKFSDNQNDTKFTYLIREYSHKGKTLILENEIC